MRKDTSYFHSNAGLSENFSVISTSNQYDSKSLLLLQGEIFLMSDNDD